MTPLPEVTDVSEIDDIIPQVLGVALQCKQEQYEGADASYAFIPDVYAAMAAKGVYLPDGFVFATLKAAEHYTGLWVYVGEGFFSYRGKSTHEPGRHQSAGQSGK